MSTTQHTLEYRASKDGKIFSISSNWRGYGERELAQNLNSNGYPSVRLIILGRRKRIAVHRLVAAEHLIPRPTMLHEIRHLDGNKMNNHTSNLAWGTRKENAADREAHGRASRGETHSLAIKKGKAAKND